MNKGEVKQQIEKEAEELFPVRRGAYGRDLNHGDKIAFIMGASRALDLLDTSDKIPSRLEQLEQAGLQLPKTIPDSRPKAFTFDPYWIGSIQCKNCKQLRRDHNNPIGSDELICPN